VSRREEDAITYGSPLGDGGLVPFVRPRRLVHPRFRGLSLRMIACMWRLCAERRYPPPVALNR
jgi:hypothetical protein